MNRSLSTLTAAGDDMGLALASTSAKAFFIARRCLRGGPPAEFGLARLSAARQTTPTRQRSDRRGRACPSGDGRLDHLPLRRRVGWHQWQPVRVSTTY